jgi:hypothetical protein
MTVAGAGCVTPASCTATRSPSPATRSTPSGWNVDDVLDVQASLFRPGENYLFMDMLRDQRGFMWADCVTRDGEPVGVGETTCTTPDRRLGRGGPG